MPGFGEWKFRCRRCQLNYYSPDMRKDWMGRTVCKNCNLPKPEYLQKQPIVVEDITPPIVSPNTPRPQAVPEQDGISRWGKVYSTLDGLKADVKWSEWTGKWND